MKTVQVTHENFAQLIQDNETVIFDFWAPWCGPCRFFAPVFEKAAEANPDIVFAKVNTEDQTQLAAALNIQAIPTLMVFKDQIGIFNQAGALPEPALTDLIDKVRDLDMDTVRQEIETQEAS